MMTFDMVSVRCKVGGKFIESSFSYLLRVLCSIDMEDAHATILKLDDNRWSQWSYFGVFDGHAGFRTAVKASEKLHLRLVSCLNQFAQEHLNKSSAAITSSQLDFHQFEMAIKDAYFKFDNEWREENRTTNPGRKKQRKLSSCHGFFSSSN